MKTIRRSCRNHELEHPRRQLFPLPTGRANPSGEPLVIRRLGIVCLLLAGLTMLAPAAAPAADIAVDNVTLEAAADGKPASFRFDVRWNQSWRRTWTDRTGNVENWDAAWIVIKIRTPKGDWRHALLGTTGAQAPADCVIQVVSNGVGAFVYRSAVGEGSVEFRDVRLPWDVARQDLAATEEEDIRVIAMEMVYVPQGPFFLGSGGTDGGCFHKAPSSPLPYRLQRPYEITGEDAFAMAEERGALTRSPHANCHGDQSGERAGSIPETFPKGFRAFYCMKYELSQGEYAAFLNMLPSSPAAQRNGAKPGWGCTIAGDHPDLRAGVPSRACNFLDWPDAAAYADWTGLRPMTEFEFEKACRGTVPPVPHEYAWGNTLICSSLYEISDVQSTEALVLNPATGRIGNAAYANTTGWKYGSPMRCGLFRASASLATRENTGATYYGILDMSGNHCETVISVGNPAGRSFSGLHGDGTLTEEGNADVPDWPGLDAEGTGSRGGGWSVGPNHLRISDRSVAVNAASTRTWCVGWRGVRTAPGK